MDLPTCPACGQSVLDDDSEECPWCGASMKTGKPSGKKPATAAAPTTPAAQSLSAKSAEKPSAPPAPKPRTAPATKSDNDLPFESESPAATAVARAVRKPAKGRTYKVVCPMCETVGYIPKRAAGKDVQCANSKCMVPVFTAPEIPREEPEPEPEKKKLSPAILSTIALLAAAVIGGGVYFATRPAEPVIVPPAPPRPPVNGGMSVDTNNPSTDNDDARPANGESPSKPPEMSLVEIQSAALGNMVQQSLRSAGNRSKPFCRRLTAEAYALAGNVNGAREQIAALEKVGDDVPYLQVLPWAAIAWHELQAERPDAVALAVEKAWSAAEKSPGFGREPLDNATALAAVLVAVDRVNDAESLLRRPSGDDPVRQLSAVSHAARVWSTATFDDIVEMTLLEWANPQRATVTIDLLAHGKFDSALAWAQQSTSRRQRSECIAAAAAVLVADALARQQPHPQTQIAQLADAVEAAGKARLYAQVAWIQQRYGATQAAEESLANAVTELKALRPPVTLTLPDMKELTRFQLPERDELQTRALAAAEVARVQLALGKADAAWESLQTALQFPRGIAPSPPAIQQRLEEIQTLGINGVAAQLQQLLDLESADKARIAARNYRTLCNSIQEAADDRFRFQLAILSRFAAFGLHEKLWNELQARENHTDLHEREHYLQSSLPWTLAAHARAAGETAVASAVEAAVANAKSAADPLQVLQHETARAIDAGQFLTAAEALQRTDADVWQRRQWSLQLASRLAAKDIAAAFQFANVLHDPVWREEALELVATEATRRGDARHVWKFARTTERPAAEMVSIYRGLVGGLGELPEPKLPLDGDTEDDSENKTDAGTAAAAETGES